MAGGEQSGGEKGGVGGGGGDGGGHRISAFWQICPFPLSLWGQEKLNNWVQLRNRIHGQ